MRRLHLFANEVNETAHGAWATLPMQHAGMEEFFFLLISSNLVR